MLISIPIQNIVNIVHVLTAHLMEYIGCLIPVLLYLE